MEACYLLHQIIHELLIVTHEIDEARLLTPVQQTIVNTALKYIDEHYKDDLSVDSICQKVNFSKFYFCKIFKQCFQKSFIMYLSEFRVEKAKELLEDTMVNIKDVSSSVGYRDSNYFAKVFKRMTGCTPSDYRFKVLQNKKQDGK